MSGRVWKKITDARGAISPILITNVSASMNIDGNQGNQGFVLVTWTTDKASTTQVAYGLFPNLTSYTAETDIVTGVTSHTVSFTLAAGVLTQGQLYAFKVMSRYIPMDGYVFSQTVQTIVTSNSS